MFSFKKASGGFSQPGSAHGAVWNHDEVALLLLDFQEEMFDQIRSDTGTAQVDLNVRFLMRVANAVAVPVILSTFGVAMGVNGPTRRSIAAEFPDARAIDRSSLNAWEDLGFRNAVIATGKKRLIVCALHTETCLVFPVIEALKEGFEVMCIADAVGGRSQIAHATALQRLVNAGAIPNTALAASIELFRDWKSSQAERLRPVLVWYLGELNDQHACAWPSHVTTAER